MEMFPFRDYLSFIISAACLIFLYVFNKVLIFASVKCGKQ